MIEVQNLTKYYGTYCALDKVSFSVRKGEILGFLGPNGAGKSTTMKVITCYLSPTEGSVTVDGLDVVEKSLEVRKRIGYLPETPPLYPDMTVKNYLEFAGTIKGVAPGALKSKVELAVEKCGLTNYYYVQCRALSKGYRQRVGIAQAMVHDPMVLILDEPTIGLDPIQIVEIRNLIKGFGGDHTVVLSTHILPEVDMTCERVLIINEGKVIAEDTTKNLKSNIPQTEQLLLEVAGGGDALLGDLKSIDGVEEVVSEASDTGSTIYKINVVGDKDPRVEISRAVARKSIDLLEFKNVSLSLEDIFINVTMN